AGTLRIVGVSDDARLAIVARGREMPTAYDILTGESAPLPAEAAPTFYDRVERVHRNLWLGLGFLVTLATFALLFQVGVGPFLAPLRAPRSPLTWHSAAGWVLWPLAVLLPLTAALIVLPIGRPFGIRHDGPEVPIARSLATASAAMDLSHLGTAQRLPGGALFVVTDGPEGEARQIYANGKVYRFGGPVVRLAHAVHTGEWGGIWGGVVDLAGASVLLTLLGTGLWSWWRRRRAIQA
ncbi:MAG TPA: PepSY domain-containing protein, partial [Gemmatimonadales bacterium]|nr:PepSY domain-containing protein [Gemmatimonadales bacterium]